MQKNMNYCIIGCGFIFPRHVDAILQTGGRVIMTCDINPIKNADFIDYREMLKSDKFKNEVDAVVICTPNYLHAEMIRDCLQTGKKVLCEKPLTIYPDFSGLEGVNVVQQLHFHPLFNHICERLKNAKSIKAVLRAYRDEEFWNSWKGNEMMSGGVVYILGAHIWDLLVYALGTDFKIIEVDDGMKRSNGIVEIGGKKIEFSFEFLCSREGQTRHLEIDGEKYILSLRDNLSFENMHDKVHEAFKIDKTPKLKDIEPSIRLIDAIKSFN